MSTQAAPDKAKTEKKRGGSMKLIVIAVVVLLLVGGGAGGYWFFVMRPHAATAEAEGEHAGGEGAAKKKKAAEGGAALKFDPFVVNLADQGGSRYLRVGLSLVIEGDEAEAKALEEGKVKLLRIRSAVIELLSQQTSEHVVTAEGKQQLKEAIEKHATEILDPVEVTDVLFTEFVVQF
jgi:flagellar FliL protein